jgi:hypothetical protein
MWRGSPPAQRPALPESIGPQPSIFLRSLDQPRAHRVLPNVLAFRFPTLIRSQHMIKRLLLPHRPLASQQPIHAMSRSAFQAMHDVNQTERPPASIAQRPKQQMNMIRHHDGGRQLDALSMIVQTMLQDEIASRFRQNPSPKRSKCNEQRSRSDLIVRKAPPILIPRPLQAVIFGHKCRNVARAPRPRKLSTSK